MLSFIYGNFILFIVEEVVVLEDGLLLGSSYFINYFTGAILADDCIIKGSFVGDFMMIAKCYNSILLLTCFQLHVFLCFCARLTCYR